MIAEVLDRDGLVSTHRSRVTGTVVALYRNAENPARRDDPMGWSTVCVDHGQSHSYPRWRVARYWAPEPHRWCPTCEKAQQRREETGT